MREMKALKAIEYFHAVMQPACPTHNRERTTKANNPDSALAKLNHWQIMLVLRFWRLELKNQDIVASCKLQSASCNLQSCKVRVKNAYSQVFCGSWVQTDWLLYPPNYCTVCPPSSSEDGVALRNLLPPNFKLLPGTGASVATWVLPTAH